MSVREDREKSNCSGRGLGLAAAAIGVAAGAALYYFFNKSAENRPDTEGSTQNWQCDDTPLYMAYSASEESFTTLSEHTTSDTSIASCDDDVSMPGNSLNYTDNEINITLSVSDDSIISVTSNSTSNEDLTHETGYMTSPNQRNSSESDLINGYMTSPNQRNSSESDLSMEWDVTNSSLDIPSDQRDFTSSPLRFLTSARSRREPSILQQQQDVMRMQAFRERSWSLEECSICFDVILKDQDVMALPCTHLFHSKCIMPWMEQQQTCPNCRKACV